MQTDALIIPQSLYAIIEGNSVEVIKKAGETKSAVGFKFLQIKELL